MILVRKLLFFFASGGGHGPHFPGEIELEGGGFMLLEGTNDRILEE